MMDSRSQEENDWCGSMNSLDSSSENGDAHDSSNSISIDEQTESANPAIESIVDRFLNYLNDQIVPPTNAGIEQEFGLLSPKNTPRRSDLLITQSSTPNSKLLVAGTEPSKKDFEIHIPTRIKKVSICSHCFEEQAGHQPSKCLDRIINRLSHCFGREICDVGYIPVGTGTSVDYLPIFALSQLLLSEFLRVKLKDVTMERPKVCRGHCMFDKRPVVSVHDLEYPSPKPMPVHRLLKDLLLLSLKAAEPSNPFLVLRVILSKIDGSAKQLFKHLKVCPAAQEQIDEARQRFGLELKPLILELIAEMISENDEVTLSRIDTLVEEDCDIDLPSIGNPQITTDESMILRLLKVYLGLNLSVSCFETLLSLTKTVSRCHEIIRKLIIQHLHNIFTSQTLLKIYSLRIVRLLDFLLKQPEWISSLLVVEQSLVRCNPHLHKLEDIHPIGNLFRLSYIGDIIDNIPPSSYGRDLASICEKFTSSSLMLPQNLNDPIQFICQGYETHLESIMLNLLEYDSDMVFSFLSRALKNNLQRVSILGILGLLSPESSKCSSNSFSLTLSRVFLRLVGQKLSQFRDDDFTEMIEVEVYAGLQNAVYGKKTDVIDVQCEAKLIHHKKSTKRDRSCTSKPDFTEHADTISKITNDDVDDNLDFGGMAIASSLSHIGSKQPDEGQSSVREAMKHSTVSKEKEDKQDKQDSPKRTITKLIWYTMEIIRLHLIPTLQEISSLQSTYITVENVYRRNELRGNLDEGLGFLSNMKTHGAIMRSYMSNGGSFDDANQMYAMFLKMFLQFCGVKKQSRTRHVRQNRLTARGIIFIKSTPVSFLTEMKGLHEIYLKHHPSIPSSFTEDYLRDFICLAELILSGMLFSKHRVARHTILELLLLYTEQDTQYMAEMLQRYVCNKRAFLCGLFDYYCELGVGYEDHDLQVMESIRWKLNVLFDHLWGQTKVILQFGSMTSCTFKQVLITIAKNQSCRNYILHSVSDWSRIFQDLVTSVAELDKIIKKLTEGQAIGQLLEYEQSRLEKVVRLNMHYQSGLVQIMNHLSTASSDLLDQNDCKQMFCSTLNHVITKLQSVQMNSLSKHLVHFSAKHHILLNSVGKMMESCLDHKAWLPTLLSSESGFDSSAVNQLASTLLVTEGRLPFFRLVEGLPAVIKTLEAEAAFLENPPEEYLCSISCNLMTEPIRLTCSGMVVDKHVLMRHFVCNGQVDPFTRRKMDAESLREEPELKTRIETWRKSRLMLAAHSGLSQDAPDLADHALGKRSPMYSCKPPSRKQTPKKK